MSDTTRTDFPEEEWERLAPWWKETFTAGADVEYEKEILPLVRAELGRCRRVVDVGCGEGQVARHLANSHAAPQVIGVDPTAAQVANARLVDATPGGEPTPRPRYLRALGEALPFAAGSFDGALCCLSIEHTRDADAVLAEVARVVQPGGRFLLLINHPLYQGVGSGFIDDQILGEHYWRVGPYLHEGVSLESVDQGIEVAFAHRPLSRYINPLAQLGLYLTRMVEPAPIAEFLESSIDAELEGAIPRLMAMRFEKLS